MAKTMTTAERIHIMTVKEMPCIICYPQYFVITSSAPFTRGYNSSEYHHITDCGRRLGHMFGIPLCVDCHRGEDGFSGKNRKAWDKSLSNQLKLMGIVYRALGKKPPVYKTKIVRREYD